MDKFARHLRNLSLLITLTAIFSFPAHFTVFAVSTIQISKLNPTNGPVGSKVDIIGSGFALSADQNQVIFATKNGGEVAGRIVSASATLIRAEVPVGAVTGKVYARVGAEKSNWQRFKVDASSNLAPSVSAGPDQTITLPTSATTVMLAGTATDDGLPNGSAVTYLWSLKAGPGSVAFGNSKSLSTSLKFSVTGTYTIRLTASDSALASSDEVSITVTLMNNAPYVNAGSDQTITLPTVANLAGTATDDGLPTGGLAVSWSRIAGPGTVTFGNGILLSTTAVFSTSGIYTLRLTANDSALIATDDVVITVNSPAPINNAPIVNAGPDQTLVLPARATLNGSAPDDGLPGTPLTAAWSEVSGSATVAFDNPSALATQASFSAAGTYTLRLEVSDGALSSADDVVITVLISTSMTGETVIDGFERPEYSPAAAFKTSVSRTILEGATTGFVVSSPSPCTFAVTPPPLAIYKMVPTVTTTPSSSAVSPGTYYDALVPLNATNCSTAKYIWVDVNAAGTYSIGSATAVVTTKGNLPALPSKPMMMLMPNSFLTAGHYGAYVGGSESLGVPYLKEMVAHRLQPYGSYVVAPPVKDGLLDLTYLDPLSYQKQVIDFSPSSVWLPNFGDTTSLAAANASTAALGWKSWFYTMDEPAEAQIPSLIALLATQKASAPNVKRMVTTVYRPDVDADIFAPVAEQFDRNVAGEPSYPSESVYYGKDLWLYVSCMSHGCGTDLAGNISATRISGSDTGAPDLAMDRSAAEPFGYMLLAQKYPSVKALLYYNTVEQYKLFPKGLDMWKGETFNFGGNLDGTLLWPGRPGIEGLTEHLPVVSVRMKLLREAQNLADLLSQLDPTWVKTRVDAIMNNPRSWKRSVSEFESLQREAIQALNTGNTPSSPPFPTLTFSASPGLVTSGQSATISWSSTNATSCSASDAWSGSKATSGNEVRYITSSTSYTLTCIGPSGSVSRAASITVGGNPITGTLTTDTSGSGLNQTVTVESIGQFRLVFEAADNWGLSQWYDLVHDPSAQNNLIGPAFGVSTDITVSQPGMFQQVFYGTVPDDPLLYTRAANYYFPTSGRSFQIIEDTPSRIVVQATSHPVANAIGVLANVTGSVRYTIYPDGRIYVHAETTAQNAQTFSTWFYSIVGLQNPDGTGTVPPDTRGWVRASATQNPYSWSGATEKYLFAYWSPQTPPPYTSWSKASILMVPAAQNPLKGEQVVHSWNNFLRWGYGIRSVSMSAGQTIAQDYLIQLGTQGSTILPDIRNSSVADPIANSYLASPLP